MRFLSPAFVLLCPCPNPRAITSPFSLSRSICLPSPDLSSRCRRIRSAPIRAAGALSEFSASAGGGRGGDMAVVAAAAAADEGSPAKRFWNTVKKDLVFASYSPFLVCLASGKLEMDVFRHYLSQDAYFLQAFAQAYEVAEDCADDDAKGAIAELRKSIMRRLNLHSSNIEEWSVDLTKETTPNLATVKFTDFLRATTAGKVDGGKIASKIATPFEKTKIASYTVGAITPCMRLYSFLVRELKEVIHANEQIHPYKKWIDNYSSVSFEEATLQIEECLDELSVSLTGEELAVVQRLYKQAMELLIQFFYAQPITQQTVVPLAKFHKPLENHLIIFSDFDLTCTVVDSSAILAEIAILTASKVCHNDPDNPVAPTSSADLRKSWNDLSSQYTEEYELCIESILTTGQDETFNYQGLCKALELLSDFEKQANSRVIESGVLKGLNLDDIKRAGEHLTLESGCPEFFQKIANKKDLSAELHILSSCWCGDLIRAAFSRGSLDALNVHANEFFYEGTLSTGDIIKKMESPLDKIEAFKNILQNSSENGKHFSVYIGDSVGDLLCLLEADVGIVVGSSASLRKVGDRFGVSFVPLFPNVVDKQRQLSDDGTFPWKSLSGILYTVSSWAEIKAFILGALTF